MVSYIPRSVPIRHVFAFYTRAYGILVVSNGNTIRVLIKTSDILILFKLFYLNSLKKGICDLNEFKVFSLVFSGCQIIILEVGCKWQFISYW